MNGEHAIGTIITKNCLSFARTLVQSVQVFHPHTACYVLVVDDWHGFIDPKKEIFNLVSLEELNIPDQKNFCFKYDALELCCALKPFFLDFLIKMKGATKILYMDADIYVTDTLKELFHVLDDHDMVLIPHLDRDYPEDDLQPDDTHILLSGIFNLGFLGINSSANAFSVLNWLKRKLYNKCVKEHTKGYLADQRFFDLAIGLFPNIFIERRPGYNVAYWNLHSRTLTRNDGQWLCNGEPMYFFHFSGFQPNAKGVISSHMSRYTLSNRPDLLSLFSEYQAKLEQNGCLDSMVWPYTYDTFSNGKKISYEFRRLFRRSPRIMVQGQDPFRSKRIQSLAFKWAIHENLSRRVHRILKGIDSKITKIFIKPSHQ